MRASLRESRLRVLIDVCAGEILNVGGKASSDTMLLCAPSVKVFTGGVVDVSFQGCPSGAGPGAGTWVAIPPVNVILSHTAGQQQRSKGGGGSGAGYGGKGGAINAIPGGQAYGVPSLAYSTGSGGGSAGVNGGNGGGVVQISAVRVARRAAAVGSAWGFTPRWLAAVRVVAAWRRESGW
jgi:hypothetical protein